MKRGVLGATTLRVALSATGITAALLLTVSVVTDVVVNNSLIGSVDSRLQSFVTGMAQRDPTTPPAPDFGAQGVVDVPISLWLFDNSGNLVGKTRDAPNLTSTVQAGSGMQNIDLDGTSFRVAQFRVGGVELVAGQSLSDVDREIHTLIVTELVVAPLILLLVFGGAFGVGRRVARPLEAARRRQLAFTADASHELRTPLSVIEAETALALGKKRTVTEYRGVLERVGGESGRLRHLVDSLLWLARFDAAPEAPASESVDLGTLLESSRDRFAAVAESHNLKLEVQTDDEPSLLVAPPEWLDRLFGVLFDNACRYTPKGGTVRGRLIKERGRVGLVVEDSGAGVSDEDRARIFDRFARATTAEDGSGLGLAIGDAVVRATGGTWDVGRSQDLGGASFAVTWTRH
jgi:signal transduction histidine kinase